MKIKIDEAALKRAVEASPGFKKIQDKTNADLNEAIREVAAEMAGRPKEAVFAALKTRISEKIPGDTWNEPELNKYAEEISARSPSPDDGD